MVEAYVLAPLLVSLVSGAGWYSALSRGKTRQTYPIGEFGEKKSPTKEESKALFRAYLTQQRMAFALVWFAVALGIVFAAVLVGRSVLAPRLDLTMVSTGLGLVGDIWLGNRAWSLYTVASGKVEKALTSL